MYKLWSDKEIKFLIENYSVLDNNTLSEKLNRSIGSIKYKANILGLFKKETWKAEEINYLIEELDNLKIATLAERLGRTEVAIRKKMSHLGLKKENEMSATEISKIINVDVKVVLKWEKKGLKMSSKSKAYRSPKIIRFNTFIKFLRNNQELWDSTKVELFALGNEPAWLKEKRKKDYIKKIENKNLNKTWTRLEEEKLIFYRNKGMSLKEISKILGRTERALSRKYCKLYYSKKKESERNAI